MGCVGTGKGTMQERSWQSLKEEIVAEMENPAEDLEPTQPTPSSTFHRSSTLSKSSASQGMQATYKINGGVPANGANGATGDEYV